jgi:methylglutaconyl-CoA hydratase
MSNYIKVETDRRGVCTLTLSRPEIHNAFDSVLIAQLTGALDHIGKDNRVRVVVLTGEGKSFSAGADLNWMRSMADATQEENLADSLALAALMRALNFLRQPTIARINGAAFGGGVGLVACCDNAVAADSALFGLTEVRLGLVPAVISPYVVEAIGVRQARRLFVTAERIDAATAHRIGLVHSVCPANELDLRVEQEIDLILKAGPGAAAAAKALSIGVAGRSRDGQQQMDQHTATLISNLRVSEEGQEGLIAFLEKRDPDWIVNLND